MLNVLLVDDEPNVLESLGDAIELHEHTVQKVSNGSDAMEMLKTNRFDVVLSDYRMPGMNGQELLAKIFDFQPDQLVVMITAHGDIRMAVETIHAGAFDFLPKPVDMQRLVLVLDRVATAREREKRIREQLQVTLSRSGGDMVIAASPVMKNLLNRAAQAAVTDSTIFLGGASGVGKEVLARFIHEQSNRKHGPFVPVNCAAFPENLLESELFGHEKGAFTGAHERKPGRFETAFGGTVFLDEIGEISPAVQVKLLSILQSKQFSRLGGVQTIPANIRIISATNRDLPAMVRAGTFREDLFFRLNVVPFHIPSLTERPEDIPELVHFFAKKLAAEMGKPLQSVHPGVIEWALRQEWPGNVRELRNRIERALVFMRGDHLELHHVAEGNDTLTRMVSGKAEFLRVEDFKFATVEKALLEQVLAKHRNNVSRAARELGISRGTIYSKMTRYGLAEEEALEN